MELPYPWELRESKQEKYYGRVYYINTETNQTTWIRPIPYPGEYGKDYSPPFYLCEIFIRFDPSTRTKKEALDYCNKLIEKLKQKDTKFEDVARENSDSESKANGGEIGWVSIKDLPKQCESSVRQLNVGEMTQPIQTDKGYYLILRRG